MGQTVTRKGKTYYKADDGKLYADYNAAARAVDSRRMLQPWLNDQAPGAVAEQRSSMSAARASAPIQLKDALLGAQIPGGPAYGAVRGNRQVLVQRGAAGTGANHVGSINFAGQTLDPLTVGKDVMWVPRGSKPTEIENRYGIAVAKPVRDSELDSSKIFPAIDTSWTAHVTPAASARESEARRMMQQYASKDYWDTEQGKAMKDLALQDQYKGKDLASYYAAQRNLGDGAIDEIIQGMGYTGAMAEWANANKGLALREYMKKFPTGFTNDTSGEIAGAMPQNYVANEQQYWQGQGGQEAASTINAFRDAQIAEARKKGFSDQQILAQLSAISMQGDGMTIGNNPGATAQANRVQMPEIQPAAKQSLSTGTGEGAPGMQPSSAAAPGSPPLAAAYGVPNMLPPGEPPWGRTTEADAFWRRAAAGKLQQLRGLPRI